MSDTTTTPRAIPGYSGAAAAIIPGAVYVAERPGGGGRSHRVKRREDDLSAARAAGVACIVSGMRSHHGLIEAAVAGFGVRWHPLRDIVQARAAVPALASDVADTVEHHPGAVLVHVDRWGEWDTAITAAILIRMGISPDAPAALERAAAYGLPVGDMAREILAA